MKRREPRGTHAGASSRSGGSARSLGLSLAVHASLIGGLVGASFFVGDAPTPRRILNMAFADSSQPLLLEDEPEQQDPSEPLAEPALDPSRFVDDWQSAPAPRPLPDPRALEHAELDEIPYDEWSDNLLTQVELTHLGPEPPPAEVPEPPPVTSPELPADLPLEPPLPTEPTAQQPATPLPAPPRLEGKDPEYPRASWRIGEQGSVELRLRLDPEGRVVAVELESSSGHRRLDQAAMSAAPLWRFDLSGLTPAEAARPFLHTVHFRLAAGNF